jgi:hypothetical protein
MTSSLNPPRLAPWCWILLTVLAVAATIACVLSVMTGIRALWWVEAKAKMIQCDVVPDSEGVEGLTVRYAYAYNGESYTGNRFGFFDGAPKTKWSEDYQAGREVAVFINPQNPSEALLRREMTLLHWLLPGIFAIIAAGFGYGAQKALAQQRIADAATLYTLETTLTKRPSLRRRRRRRTAESSQIFHSG